MTDVLMTSIVLKADVTLLDIVSTRMLGQFGFLSKASPHHSHRKLIIAGFFVLKLQADK